MAPVTTKRKRAADPDEQYGESAAAAVARPAKSRRSGRISNQQQAKEAERLRAETKNLDSILFKLPGGMYPISFHRKA
jgi:hypothetical protein